MSFNLGDKVVITDFGTPTVPVGNVCTITHTHFYVKDTFYCESPNGSGQWKASRNIRLFDKTIRI